MTEEKKGAEGFCNQFRALCCSCCRGRDDAEEENDDTAADENRTKAVPASKTKELAAADNKAEKETASELSRRRDSFKYIKSSVELAHERMKARKSDTEDESEISDDKGAKPIVSDEDAGEGEDEKAPEGVLGASSELKSRTSGEEPVREVKSTPDQAAKSTGEDKSTPGAVSEESEIKSTNEAASEESKIKSTPEAVPEESEVKNKPEMASKESEVKNKPETASKESEVKNKHEAPSEESEVKNDPEAASEKSEVKDSPEAASEESEVKDSPKAASEESEVRNNSETTPVKNTRSDAAFKRANEVIRRISEVVKLRKQEEGKKN